MAIWFPWGRQFDHSLYNIRQPQRDRRSPVPVDDYSSDVSVYGVRAWPATFATGRRPPAARRRGRRARRAGWNSHAILTRCAYRAPYDS